MSDILLLTKPLMNEEEIWFMPRMWNGLYKYSLTTDKISLVTTFDNEPLLQTDLYFNMKLYDNKIVFVPLNAKRIAVYDIKLKEMLYFDLPAHVVQRKYQYRNCFVYGAYVYFIGNYSNVEILKLDLNTKKVKTTHIILEKIEPSIKTSEVGEGIAEGSNVYIPIIYKNCFAVFDLKKERCFFVKELPVKGEDNLGAMDCNSGMLLQAYGNLVMKKNGKKLDMWAELPSQKAGAIAILEQRVYISDLLYPRLFVFNLNGDFIGMIDTLDEKPKSLSYSSAVLIINGAGEHLIAFSYYSNELLWIQDGSIVKRVRLETEEIPFAEDKVVYCKNTGLEGMYPRYNLDSFLGYVSSEENRHRENRKGCAGQQIYAAVCGKAD